MRADDNVNAALAKKLEDFALLALRPKPAEHFNPHRIIEHALAKNLEVLLRGHEPGDFSAVHYGFERGADRHFRFTEAGVTADQPVHRSRLLHVDLRVDD